MIDLDTLRTLRGKLQQGLRDLQVKEAEAMESRLRQEGALWSVEQLIGQAGAVQAIAVPLQEEASDGSNH
jgi:hypothetical protein